MTRLRQLLITGGLGAALVLAPGAARAASSFVTVEQEFDGVTNVLRRVSGELGVAFSSGAAPSLAGWRFIGWTVSTAPETVVRDLWGRAFDVVSVKIYEETTFTAHYLSVGCDTDEDGIADGEELYWYGSLNRNAASDMDRDGFSFAAELEAGTNPHFPDADEEDRFGYGVVSDGQDDIVYNPREYPVCTFRSDPEGVLFTTYSEVAAPGTALASPAGMIEDGFAFWQIAGTPQRDAFGRACDMLALTQVSNDLIIVAVVETNALKRASLYWYGRTDVAADSDTDGDGLTFAEELELGTNPLFADEDSETDGVLSDGRDGVLYNPHGWRPYVVRAEDGKLFKEYADYVAPGTRVTTPALDSGTSDFAGWSVDGVVLRDSFGRALDAASFVVSATGTVVVAHAESSAATRAALYWYGRTDVSLDSDTDDDGKTLAEEIAEGTNPLFADSAADGGVEFDGRDDVELNVQFYERVDGFVIDGVNQRVDAGTQIWPVVADVNADGLWDLIVCSATMTNVFVNTGSKGNPQFAKCGSVGADVLGGLSVDLEMNSTAKLAGMTLDVAPVGALSATTNGTTLLVSDSEGRIWYYMGESSSQMSQLSQLSYTLAHKVWGGSYAGFAQGLRLAAVDWEDDGDLDCLCGTADGKMMLLRDPKVGRPSNLRAAAGADNVKLDWDPNEQSRVRGYKVYRNEDSALLPSSFSLLTSTQLPTYRDMGLSAGTYGYKVSALSRFYTAGNSTPTVTESVATEPVVATVGGEVPFYQLPVLKRWNGKVIYRFAISNALNFVANNLAVNLAYDPAALEFDTVESGSILTNLTSSVGDSVGCVTLTIAHCEAITNASCGVVFTFVFNNIAYPGYDSMDILGDVNLNGKLDSRDHRQLQSYVTAPNRLKPRGGAEAEAWAQRIIIVGDMNGNGKIDGNDYTLLKKELQRAGVIP